MNPEKTTAERLLELRRLLGLDQEALAAQLMVSRSYLSQLENGREPSTKLVELIRRLERDCEHCDVHSVNSVTEAETPYLPSGAAGFSDAALAITEKIQARIFEVVSAANGDPVKLGWIHEQLAQHLRPPAHWPKITPHAAPATGIVVPQERAPHHQHRSATG